MIAYYLDTESDGLLEDTKFMHCLVLRDINDPSKVYSYADRYGYPTIDEGLERLSQADLIVGHNLICHDLPVLQKLCGWTPSISSEIHDTLVTSRLVWPDLATDDAIHRPRMASRLKGSHSLEAHGVRMGVAKDSFGKTADWSEWSQEMQDYCERDTEVGLALYQKIMAENPTFLSIALEHEFQKVIFQQEQFGFAFDKEKAGKLHAKLIQRKLELQEELQRVFPPVVKPMKLPEFYVATAHYVDGKQQKHKAKTKAEASRWLANERKLDDFEGGNVEPGPLRTKTIPFNPGSRDQIAAGLKERHGWNPVLFTESGKAKIDESVLAALPYPEAKLLSEYMTVEKRLGQLAEGENSWLKLEKNGRIHGRVITNGAVTGRCTHMKPNVAQTPAASESVPYGKEMRELFHADDGFVEVGADASGLELRCLAHYMAKYDNGAYAKIILEGDIHSANRDALGLEPTKENRSIAKTFIYAFLYGAGPLKIGRTLGVADSEIEGLLENKKLVTRFVKQFKNADTPYDKRMVAEAVKGAVYQERFLANLPALAKLKADINYAVEKKGYLTGLDGRKLPIRSRHAALNTLLQSAGALIVKRGTVLMHELFRNAGYVYGKDYAQLAHIHDEVQLQAQPGISQEIGTLAVRGFQDSGKLFKLRVPIDGEFKVGRNWAETH